jgi:ferredoxin-NADP reductase
VRTIRANLKHYQPEYKTIIPATRLGFWAPHDSFARHHFVCGPERFDGWVSSLLEHHGRGTGVHSIRQDFARSV